MNRYTKKNLSPFIFLALFTGTCFEITATLAKKEKDFDIREMPNFSFSSIQYNSAGNIVKRTYIDRNSEVTTYYDCSSSQAPSPSPFNLDDPADEKKSIFTNKARLVRLGLSVLLFSTIAYFFFFKKDHATLKRKN